MSDESIISLSDESKSGLRNYVMAAGFIAMFVFATIVASINLCGQTTYQYFGSHNVLIATIFFLVLLSLGITLAMLHKRDLVSITFILIGISIFLPQFGAQFYGGFTSYSMIAIVLICGVMFLFTRNEQRIACSTLLILRGLMFITVLLPEYNYGLVAAISIITALVTAYFALAICLENPKMPLYNILTADESDESKDGSPVHFKVTGSILGYMLFSAAMLSAILYYAKIDDVSIMGTFATESVCGMMLIVTGFIMLVAGRMRFTSMLFIMLGTVTSTTVFMTDISYISCLFYFLIAAICIFKKDRRLYVGVAIFFYGLTYLVSGAIGGTADTAGLSLVLNLIPFLILMFVCLGLCSDGRIKLA